MFALMQEERKVFVTGASGFIGTYICYRLLQLGHQVSAMKRETSDLSTHRLVFETLNADGLNPVDADAVVWHTADILDPNGVIDATAGCDTIVHAAASVSFQPRERAHTLKNNIDGTANIVNACVANGIKRLVHISSVAALPNPDKKDTLSESFENSTFFEFNTTYGESKYRSEMEVWRGSGEDLDVTVFNPGIVLGKWHFVNSSVQMFRSVFKGLKVYSSGYTGFVAVEDIADAVAKALSNEASIGQRYILVGDNQYYKDFLFSIADALGKKRPGIKAGLTLSTWVGRMAELWAYATGGKAFITREIAQSANRHTHFENEKVQKQLGLSFRSVNETIAETAKFFTSHPELR